jgi:hypothetical protein
MLSLPCSAAAKTTPTFSAITRGGLARLLTIEDPEAAAWSTFENAVTAAELGTDCPAGRAGRVGRRAVAAGPGMTLLIVESL